MQKQGFNVMLSLVLSLGLTQAAFSQDTQMSGMNTNTNSTTTVTTQTEAPATSTTSVAPVSSTTTTSPTVIKQTTVTTDVKPMTTNVHANLSPQEIFIRLREGNQRFVAGNMKNRDWVAQASATALLQMPYAIVLSCMDSRTPPEIIFDQGIGDIFAIRVAGNVQNDDILGSMEFGTKVVGAKLIAVIGHTNCGAMRGACEQAKLGFLTPLLQKIQPAVQAATKTAGKHDCSSDAYIDEVAKQNVLMVMKQIQARSPVIHKLIQEGKLGIVGGIQDLSTGQVTFLDDESIMPVEVAPVAPVTQIDNVNPSATSTTPGTPSNNGGPTTTVPSAPSTPSNNTSTY